MLKAIKQSILQWWNELDKKYFLGMLLFSLFVFFPLVSQRLTNAYDGMWTTAEYWAGIWELSNGRWLWPVLNSLRFSIQLNPINAMACLMTVSLGVTLLHQLFEKEAGVRASLLSWLAGAGYVSSVVVACYLSFTHQSVEFGISFFLSVIAAYCAIRAKKMIVGIISGAVFLAMSLGLYQTNLACFCLVMLAYFLLLLFRNEEKQKIREHICRSLASAASGAVLYLLILKVVLWATGTAMADYQGGADVSVSGILKNLPSSIAKCYELFYRYFFGTLVKHNILQETAVVFVLMFFVVGAALACRLVRLVCRKDWENTFYGIAALLVLPMMCTVFMVATSQAAFYIPMSGGLALFLPVCFWLLDSSREDKTACDVFHKCWNKAEKALTLLTAAAVVYGSVFMSAVDQQAMYEGRQATKELSDLIAQTLVSEGYYDNEIPVMLVGNASSNPLFRTHKLYHKANPYARVGLFMAETAGTIRFSWNAAFRDYTPIWLNLCDDKTYQELLETEEIAEMPTFPQEGSIRKMDDVLVIKVSEEYHLDPDWKNKMMSGEYD
mgnify:FL=1